MLFIGAYRDNEVDAAHPLMALRDKLQAPRRARCPRWRWAR